MPDDPYTLGDLSRLADVTPRTVRYYIAQGLLPGPETAGPATRYGEGHLARLRLIRALQRDHLPLAEIRLRLERLHDDEVIATVSALDARPPAPPEAPGEALDFVRSLMQRSGVRPSIPYGASGSGLRLQKRVLRESLAEADADAAAPAPPAPAPAANRPPPPAAAAVSASMPAPASPAPPVAGRSTWERLVITPDIELHVRRPLDRSTNKRVDQLERIARELFEDA